MPDSYEPDGDVAALLDDLIARIAGARRALHAGAAAHAGTPAHGIVLPRGPVAARTSPPPTPPPVSPRPQIDEADVVRAQRDALAELVREALPIVVRAGELQEVLWWIERADALGCRR